MLFTFASESLLTTTQSDTIQGRINLTCDAWQANNTDTYFAVTDSWIEENMLGVWELKMTLLGFVKMNNVHNGVQLAQALYQVVKRLGVAHKVGRIIRHGLMANCNLQIGHVTCDNTTNMDTMMMEFGSQVEQGMGKKYNGQKRRVR